MTAEIAAPAPTPRAAPTDVLRDLLAELIDLSLLAQHAQWNLVGAKSGLLHRLLDGTRASSVDHARAVAERINCLDTCPDGRVHVVAGLSSLPQPKVGRLADTYVSSQFAAIHSKMIRRIRSRGMAVGPVDRTTHVLLVQIASELEDQYEAFQSVLRQCGHGRGTRTRPGGQDRPPERVSGSRSDIRVVVDGSR